jgi:hypothetical protein
MPEDAQQRRGESFPNLSRFAQPQSWWWCRNHVPNRLSQRSTQSSLPAPRTLGAHTSLAPSVRSHRLGLPRLRSGQNVATCSRRIGCPFLLRVPGVWAVILRVVSTTAGLVLVCDER